ncbi:MAG TPA: sialidase family protein, partial [Gemmatimonadaceae bacterium]|nr:sialidase family protein [Gemmatimonadaceae bacterium]
MPAPAIHVGPNIQVSRSRAADTHYEVTVATHPRDPSRLVVGSIIYPESGTTYGTIVYASADGGVTWNPVLEGGPLDHTGDPAMAFGPDGTAYYAASSLPAGGERTLLLFRSHTGGASWAGPFALTYMDREFVTVDATGGPFHGRVYVTGNSRVPRTISDFVVFQSSESGASFRGPGTRAAFGSARASVMGNAVVASDGTLIGVCVEEQPGAAGGGR